MVSTDRLEKTTRFAEKHGGNTFVILSDRDKVAGKAYGVLLLGKFAKRWTFYIDKDGVITEIDKKVKAGSAGKDMVKVLENRG